MLKKMSHQQAAVRKINHFKGRALLADEMGLGKSIEVLLWLKEHPENTPIIIVCPATMKWVWESFIRHILKKRSLILNSQTPSTKPFIYKPSFIIINYEILQYWMSYLRELEARTLVIDEGHYIKSRRTKRAKAVLQLAKGIPNVLALSGTPLLNRPAELWTTIHLIRPDIFNSLYEYRWRHCKPERTPWGWLYKGATNLKELHRKLRTTMMIRNLKEGIVGEKIRYVVPLEIKNRKDYEEALNNFIQWLSKKSKAKVERAKKAKRLVQMGYLKRLAAKLKMEAILKWVDDFLEGQKGKLVLFCIHKEIVNQLYTRYKSISVKVDGSVSGRKRKYAIKKFQNNKQIRLFIGNIKAAGLGITLTAANTLAFVELDWVPGNHLQAEDRIHRIGQTKTAFIYYLVAKNTIEEKLCKILQKKQIIISATLDGSKKVNQLDVYKQLEKELLKGQKNESRINNTRS